MQRSDDPVSREGEPATRSPAQWEDLQFPKNARGVRPFDHWKHGAARALHKWKLHEHHAGAPLQLAEADYLGALAAVEPPPGQPMVPHPGAMGAYPLAADPPLRAAPPDAGIGEQERR